jgi:hypothetical protein
MGRIGRITLILLLAIFALWAVDYVSLLFSPRPDPPVEKLANHGIPGADQRYRCPKSQGIVSAGISLIGQGLARIADWSPEAWTAACTAILASVTAIGGKYLRRLDREGGSSSDGGYRPSCRPRAWNENRSVGGRAASCGSCCRSRLRGRPSGCYESRITQRIRASCRFDPG